MRRLFLPLCLLATLTAAAQIKVDYRPYQSPVKNQHNRGTCTAFAILAMMETFPGFPADLSEQYTYANVKSSYYDSMAEYDEGAKISNYIHTLQSDGLLREDQMPYNPDAPVWDKAASNFDKMKVDIKGARLLDLLKLQDFTYRLTPGMYILKKGEAAQDVAWIKKQLDAGTKSIAVGYAVNGNTWFKHQGTRADKIDPGQMLQVVDGDKVYDYKVASILYLFLEKKLRDGSLKVRFKDSTLRPDEGHAVSIVGYDESGFLIKNSWGEDWGDGGYGWVSFDYHRLFCTQAMAVISGQVDVAAWTKELSSQPSDIYLKSLPGRFENKHGLQLSFVFHSKGAPARIQATKFEVYDCNGVLLDKQDGYVRGIFDGRAVGYNTDVLEARTAAFDPACEYTVKVAFTMSGGQQFTNVYRHVKPYNREYAPELN